MAKETNEVQTVEEIKPVKEDKIKPVGSAVKSFSEVYDAQTPWEMTHKELKDVTFQINKASKIETGYGMAFLCDCLVDNENKKVLIGAKVLVKQLETIQFDLPIKATIKKVGRYYTFN